MSKLSSKPTHIVKSIEGIDPEQFLTDNPWVQAISYDRDGTLTDYHDLNIPDRFVEVLREFARIGIAQGFNSNSGSAEKAASVHALAMAVSDAINAEFYVSTSYEAGGRKPGPRTFELFSKISSIPVENTVHIGDQWLKDIKGARQAGLGGAVLVARYGEKDDPRVRYLQRPTIEAITRVAFGLPLFTDNFPDSVQKV